MTESSVTGGTSDTKLGWAVDTSGNPTKLFQIEDSDVSFDPEECEYLFIKNEDNKASKEIFARDMEIQVSLWKKVLGTSGYKHENQKTKIKEDKHSKITFYIYKMIKCGLSINEQHLLSEYKVSDNTTQYIASGHFIKGYRLTIDADFDLNANEGKSIHTGNITNLLSFISPKGKISNSNDETDEKANVKINIQAFGGVESPEFDEPKRKTFDQDIEKIINKLKQNLSKTQSRGKFIYEKEDLKPLPAEMVSPQAVLVNIIAEIIKSLPQTINLEKPLCEKLQSELSKINDQILLSINQKNANNLLKIEAEKLCALITNEMINKNLFFDGDGFIMRVSSGKSDMYLSKEGDDNLMIYSKMRDSFQVEEVNNGKTSKDEIGIKKFYLKNSNGKYLLRSKGKQSEYLVFGKKENAVKWQFKSKEEDGKHCEYIATTNEYTFSRPNKLTFEGGHVRLAKLTTIGDENSAKIQFDALTSKNKFNEIINKLANLFELDQYLNQKTLEVDEESDAKDLDMNKEVKMTISEDAKMEMLLKIRIPELIEANKTKINLIVGQSDAGKSTLICLMLGCELSPDKNCCTKLVVKKTATSPKRYPGIGNNRSKSKTKYPSTYGEYCDTPGFEDTEGDTIRSMHAFTTFLAKEMAEEIKSIVCVIDGASLIAGNGELFKKLVKLLSSIFKESYYETIKPNIIFVVNTKGDPRFSKKEYLKLFDEHKKKLDRDLERIKNPEQSGFFGKAKKVMSNTPIEKALQIEREIDVLELISEENLYIWKSHNDQELKKNLEKALQNISSPIQKSAIKFELTTPDNYEMLESLSNWVERNYKTPLDKLTLAIDNKDTLIAVKTSELRNLGKKERIKLLKEQLKKKENALTKKNVIKKDLEKIVQFEKLHTRRVSGKLTSKLFREIFKDSHAKTTTSQYKLGMPFVEAKRIETEENKHLKHITAKETSADKGDNKKKNYVATYQNTHGWSGIGEFDVIEIKGYGYDKNPASYEEIKEEISLLNSNISKLEKSIEEVKKSEESPTKSDFDDYEQEKLEKKEKEKEEGIEKLEEELDQHKEALKLHYKDFAEGYSLLLPIYNVLDQACKNDSTLSRPFVLDKFFNTFKTAYQNQLKEQQKQDESQRKEKAELHVALKNTVANNIEISESEYESSFQSDQSIDLNSKNEEGVQLAIPTDQRNTEDTVSGSITNQSAFFKACKDYQNLKNHCTFGDSFASKGNIKQSSLHYHKGNSLFSEVNLQLKVLKDDKTLTEDNKRRIDRKLEKLKTVYSPQQIIEKITNLKESSNKDSQQASWLPQCNIM